jgi:hypothetical protein
MDSSMVITSVVALCVGILLVIFNKPLGNSINEVNDTLPLKSLPKYGRGSVLGFAFILIWAGASYLIELFRNGK